VVLLCRRLLRDAARPVHHCAGSGLAPTLMTRTRTLTLALTSNPNPDPNLDPDPDPNPGPSPNPNPAQLQWKYAAGELPGYAVAWHPSNPRPNS